MPRLQFLWREEGYEPRRLSTSSTALIEALSYDKERLCCSLYPACEAKATTPALSLMRQTKPFQWLPTLSQGEAHRLFVMFTKAFLARSWGIFADFNLVA